MGVLPWGECFRGKFRRDEIVGVKVLVGCVSRVEMVGTGVLLWSKVFKVKFLKA